MRFYTMLTFYCDLCAIFVSFVVKKSMVSKANWYETRFDNFSKVVKSPDQSGNRADRFDNFTEVVKSADIS